MLREKDLSRENYVALALRAAQVCGAHGIPLIPHTHAVPGIEALHVPFPLLSEALARQFRLSVSVHSAGEARQAAAMGASFVIAGHIFKTACKPGVTPRGLAFLKECSEAALIPVYAIGGVTGENAPLCIEAGAAGVCRMSFWMEGDLGA